MKRNLKGWLQFVAFVLFCVICIVISSYNSNKYAPLFYKPSIYIDTINIHGQSHEILLRHTHNGKYSVGGMMHSPECWCRKEINDSVENINYKKIMKGM
ncbi:MAG: hypothetical protein HDS35_07550 [Bacteroides sp.]|nr:hypothetical protein [Bacteroides sp.]